LENIENIKNIMIFSVENIMILLLSWYISLISSMFSCQPWW